MQEDIFGIPVRFETWERKRMVPYYIRKKYDFQVVFLNEIRALLVTPGEENAPLSVLNKDLEEIKKIEAIPVVLDLKSLSTYRRKSFIQNRIAFVTKKQIFLPFLGAYLMGEEEEPTRVESFAGSAQELFLLFFYQDERKLYMSEASKRLPFSAMTVTRAVRQLEATGLFQVRKDGVNVVLESKYEKRELLAKAECYLSSPVRKKGFLAKKALTEEWCPAGEWALFQRGLSEKPEMETYAAFYKNVREEDLTTELLDPDSQVRVELWNYDPRMFSKKNEADGISLALSFKDNEKESVAEAISVLIKQMM